VPYDNTHIEELDNLEAFEAEQITAQDSYNAIKAADVPDRAFGPAVFPNVIVDPTSIVQKSHSARHTYEQAADTCDYTTFAADGLTERAVLGEPATGTYLGPSSQDTSISWSLSGSRPVILACLNVEFVTAAMPTDGDPLFKNIILAFQVLQSGTWQTVRTTERAYNTSRHLLPDLPSTIETDLALHFLLDSSDMPEPGSSVQGIRAVLAIQSTSGSATVTLDRWNFTAMQLMAEEG